MSGVRAAGEPSCDSHATPSRTVSTARAYVPIDVGAVYATLTDRDCPGSRSAPMPVRAPSHTTTAPLAAYTWYARFTGFGPAALQGTLPLFVTVTATVRDSPRSTAVVPEI